MAKKKVVPKFSHRTITGRDYHKGSVVQKQEDGSYEIVCPVCHENGEEGDLEYQEYTTTARRLLKVVAEDDGSKPTLMISGDDELDASDTGELPGISCSVCDGFFAVPPDVEWV